MTDKKPYLSVVVPTYNRAEFIVQAVESVLGQKGAKHSYEIIVVDDGSTDDTEKVLEQFKDKIRYYKIPHSGLPAKVRNFGISKARGQLIAFQDSDDLWSDDKLAKQIPLFEDPRVVLSYGQAMDVNVDGQLPKKPPKATVATKNGEKFSSLLKTNVIPTLTVVARSSVLQAAGGFDESPSLRAMEDYELWLRLSLMYPGSFQAVPNVLAYRRLHQDNISSYDPLVSIERITAVYDWLWDNFELNEAQRLALEAQLERTHENWGRLRNELEGPPAISVIMGIYKDKDYVKQAVQSILEQSFKDFEFIIIDDGSQDGSYEVVAKFKDPRIRLIRQTNLGLVNVLNKGVKLARAPLIARQDADDISLPQRFEKEMVLMGQNERLGVVGTFFRYVDEKTLEPTGITITSVTKHLDIIRHMYFDNPIGHGTALIRRQAIIEAGGYSDQYGPNEDYDLWRRLVLAGWQTALVPDVHYLYRLSQNSISRTKEELQHKLFAKLVQDIWQGPVYFKPFWSIIGDSFYYRWLDSPFHDKVYHQYKSHQVRLTFEFLTHGKLKAGYNNFLGALLIYPTGALRLWLTVLWAPIKYMREFR